MATTYEKAQKQAQANKVLRPTEDSETPNDSAANQLNSPDVIEGQPTRKAVESAAQAHSIATSLFQRSKDTRLKNAAIILSKYNGDPPFPQTELDETGQGWRNNYSTNFLASIVDRIKPQLLDPFVNADYLTKSSLAEDYDKADLKSRIFQNQISKTIRRWPGWINFCSMLAQEDLLFGYTIPVWLDPEDWRPVLFRVDEVCLPEGTDQHSSRVQLIALRQVILLHDFLELIADRKAAELAGYNLEGCDNAANTAGTIQQKDENPVKFEDAKRENITASYLFENQTKSIEVYHVLVREYDGGVDLWTVLCRTGELIRYKEGIHENMSDACTLFTIQTGNTRYYGSKGIGRMICNIHIAIERMRNLASDQQYLSGLTILLGDSVDFNSFQPVVKHPFVLVDKKFSVAKEIIQFDANDWAVMEEKLAQIAESIAGAFIPPNIQEGGSTKTKIEAAQKAEREMAVREGVLARFVLQGYDMIGTIQRAICSKVNLKEAKRIYDKGVQDEEEGYKVVPAKVWRLISGIVDKVKDKLRPVEATKIADQEAVDCIIQMLVEGLTLEEIVALSMEPSAPTQKDIGSSRDQDTMQFIMGNMQNPFQNQAEAYKMAGEISIGQDRLQRLFIPQDDPTVTAIAQRQQIIETTFMQGGQPMPVAKTDNHGIHRQVIRGETVPQIPQMLGFDPTAQKQVGPPQPGATQFIDMLASHYLQHLEMDTMLSPQQKKDEKATVAQWMMLNAKAKKVAAAQAGAQSVMGSAAAGPAGAPGQGGPAGAGPAGGAGAPPPEPMTQKDQVEAHLKSQDMLLKTRQMDLAEQEHLWQRQIDMANQQLKQIQLAQQMAKGRLDATTKHAQNLGQNIMKTMQIGHDAAQADLGRQHEREMEDQQHGNILAQQAQQQAHEKDLAAQAAANAKNAPDEEGTGQTEAEENEATE